MSGRGAVRSGVHVSGLVALFVVALNLRPHMVGVGPLLPAIREEFAVSYGLVGGLVTIPLLSMGAVAVLAVPVSRALGTRRTLAWCLLLVAVFGYARTLVDDVVWLLALTVPVGVGVGLTGVLLPIIVKREHPDHLGLATGIYATGMQLGATLSVATAVPLAVLFDGWRWPLATYSLVALAAVAVWLGGTPRTTAMPLVAPEASFAPHAWKRFDTWLLAWVFFLVSLPFFGLNAWLTAAYAELGWTLERAGLLTATFGFASIPGTLLPGLVTRSRRTRCGYMLAAAVVMLLAVLGLVLTPASAWVWVVVAGICQGGLFTVILTLPTDVGADPREVGQISSAMLTSGYILAAVAPTALGLLRDVFDVFTATLWGIAVAVAALTLSAWLVWVRFAWRPPAR